MEKQAERRTERLVINLSAEEKARLIHLAYSSGETVSSFIRNTLKEHLTKEPDDDTNPYLITIRCAYVGCTAVPAWKVRRGGTDQHYYCCEKHAPTHPESEKTRLIKT